MTRDMNKHVLVPTGKHCPHSAWKTWEAAHPWHCDDFPFLQKKYSDWSAGLEYEPSVFPEQKFDGGPENCRKLL